MKEVLIIKLGSLGDVLLAEGALRDLREHHRRDRITVLTASSYARLLERCPWVDRVWTDTRAPRWRLDRMWQLRRRLRGADFDMVYDLQNSRRTHYYYRYLFPSVAWSGTAPGCSHPHPRPGSAFGTERLALQLRAAGVPVHHAARPRLEWLAEDATDHLRRAGVEPPYAVLVAGSSARNRDKRWSHYGELAHRLRERGYTAVTAPGPDELDEAAALPAVPLLDADGGCLDLFQLAGVLKRATMVVGNDTGPTHIAAFLGVPGVALFGAHVSHVKDALREAGLTVLEHRDLAGISVDQVLAAIERLPLRATRERDWGTAEGELDPACGGAGGDPSQLESER